MATATAEADAPVGKQVVGVKYAAETLGVSENTILSWIKQGKLPTPFRAGRVIRWRKGTIDALLEGRAQNA